MKKIKYAGCLIIKGRDQFILQKRDNKRNISNPGMITTFGGGIEASESPLMGLMREIEEELTLKTNSNAYQFLGYFERFDSIKQYVVSCWFYCLHITNNSSLVCKEGKIGAINIKERLEENDDIGPICLDLIVKYKMMHKLGLIHVPEVE